MRRSRLVVAVCCSAVLAACKESAAPVPGPSLAIVSGDSQSALTGDTVTLPLRVRVTDAADNAVAGAVVAWWTANGSFVTTQTTSDADGNASATLVAGNDPANGTVVVTAGSGSAASTVNFSLHVLDRCAFPTDLTIGATVTGTISPFDCGAVGDGSRLDAFTFTTAGTERVRFTMTSDSMNPYIWIKKGDRIAAINDNRADGDSNSAVSVILPAGAWTMWANTLRPADFGVYQLVTQAEGLDVADCELAFVFPGTTTAQTLPAAACTIPGLPSTVTDFYGIVVHSLDTVTVTATAAGFAAHTQFIINGQLDADHTASGPGQPASVKFGVPAGAAGWIVVAVSASGGANAGGAYSLTLTKSGPNPAPFAVRRVAPTTLRGFTRP